MADLAIANPELDSQEIEFVLGDVVDVTRRMWPGVNKPGGVGRITKIRFNEENCTYLYDVAYVLGARETKIEPIFIKLLNDDGTRKRSIVGRCKFCKSFFRDCGHDQDKNPFEEVAEQPVAATTPTAKSVEKKPIIKVKGVGEPRVRRFNGVSGKSENDVPSNVSMSRQSSAEFSHDTFDYHTEDEAEPNTTTDDVDGERERPVTPFDSVKKDRKRRRPEMSGTPSTGGSLFYNMPLMAPAPPPPAPVMRKKKVVDQARPGSNFYGLSRLDPSNRDIAYNSLILDMHNTNRVVRLIENLNCIKRFTVHGEEQSTQYSLIC